MVAFVLKSRTANRLVYEYYPEGDTEKLPGLISVWIKKREVVLDIAAEADFIVFSTSEEIRELKDSIDEVYMELDMIQIHFFCRQEFCIETHCIPPDLSAHLGKDPLQQQRPWHM